MLKYVAVKVLTRLLTIKWKDNCTKENLLPSP